MGKKIIIKGADFSENGFPIDITQLAVKDIYFYGTTTITFRSLSGRGMICINKDDAAVPFQAGYAYSAIEIPSGATSMSFVCNQRCGVILCAKDGSDNVKLVDSGWKNANTQITYDLTQYPTAIYVCVSLDAVGSVAVEDITWTLDFE